MEKKRFIMRTVFIGLAVISGIISLVWAADTNAYTKYQVLVGRLDMTILGRIFSGIMALSICGFIGTLHFRRKSLSLLCMGGVAAVYAVGLLISVMTAPDKTFYTYRDAASGKELVVLEECVKDRRQAVIYERKNGLVIEFLGNIGYYSGASALDSGNFDIDWQENGQVLIRLKAQFDGMTENVRNGDGRPATEETKEQIFYVSGED